MKLTNVLLGMVLALGLVGFAGCKKKDASTGGDAPPMMVEGIKVDLPKLQMTVDATGNADQQGAIRNVLQAFRYRQYEKALMDLDKLINDPSLNDEQKKIGNEVIEQVKQVLAKAPAPAQ